jgi:ligand-binding sensor domain-containing protein/class 3 adenylate cyclase
LFGSLIQAKIKILFIFYLLTSLSLLGQSLFLTKYTTDNGLPQSSVYSILQDKQGYLWIGTEGGVAKYDGEEFQIFMKKEGLVALHVNDIFQDSKGNIWIATIAGLSRYDGKKFTNFKKENGLPDDFIYSVNEDSSGAIWLGSYEKGAIRYFNNKFVSFNKSNGFPSNRVLDICKDIGGNLWFATGGDGIIERTKTGFKQYTMKNGLLCDSTYSLFVDYNGRLIVGTAYGLSVFNGKKFKNYGRKNGFLNFPIKSILEDKYHNLWVCYDGGGIGKFDGKDVTNYSSKNGLPSNFVSAGLEDKRGDLWFGTQNGLFRINAERVKILTKKDGLSDNVVYAINQDSKGRYWFAPYGFGINILEKGKIKVLNMSDGLPNNSISSILFDGNIVWLGTLNGVSKYDGVKFKNYFKKDGLTGNTIFSIIKDSHGHIWFGGEGGATEYDGKKFIKYTQENGLAPEWIYTIYEDSRGNLWFGSDVGGVSFYDGKKFITYDKDNGFPSGAVFSIIEDRFGNYWFGLEGSGLVRFDGENFKHYTTKDGLSHSTCYSIIEVGKYLFVGTGKGIDRIDYTQWDQKGPDAVRVFTKDDGLPNNEITQGSGFKDSEGNIWFGTQGGVVTFNPLNKPNKFHPPIYLTGLRINKKEVNIDSLGNEFSLNPNQYNLDFAFTSISFNSRDKLIYKYKIIGLKDSSWTETHIGYISYPYLPPNSYKLIIKARNADGVWSQKPLVLKFVIAPPFYTTWWFYALVALAAIVSTYLFYLYKTEQVKKRNIELANMVRMRTKELEDEKNKSDELLQNILPSSAVEELKDRGEVEPREYKNVTILFTDFKGFTWTASVLPADKLVNELNDIFAAFDKIVSKFGLEKMKTIGDSYMAACGLPVEHEHHALLAVEAAIAMQNYIKERNENSAIKWEMRVGLHSGQVIAGVVGLKKFTYDIWGDTVNIASRMESSGEPGKINVSAFTYMLVREYYECEYRGKVEAKGKGKIDMYFVYGRKPEKEDEIEAIINQSEVLI